MKAVPVSESQWLDILRNYNSPKNVASSAEMFEGFNSGCIKFEIENQMAGKKHRQRFYARSVKINL